jgi:hypothetical protein
VFKEKDRNGVFCFFYHGHALSAATTAQGNSLQSLPVSSLPFTLTSHCSTPSPALDLDGAWSTFRTVCRRHARLGLLRVRRWRGCSATKLPRSASFLSVEYQ